MKHRISRHMCMRLFSGTCWHRKWSKKQVWLISRWWQSCL